ncbi:MAG: S8 family peptidase [Phycisphaerae bacterium]|jgi:subtilisin family serine protease
MQRGMKTSGTGLAVRLVVVAGLALSASAALAQIEDGGIPADISFDANGALDNQATKDAAGEPKFMPDSQPAWTPAEDSDDALHTRLAARNYPLAPANTPNWYYYLKTRVAMQLDHTRLAVKVDPNIAPEQAAARLITAAQRAGIAIRSGGKASSGWQFVTFERPFADAAAANTMIDDLTKLNEFPFVAPVFMSDDVQGGFLFFTDRVMALATKRDATKQALASANNPFAILEENFGLMPGVAFMGTSERNGYRVMQQANALAQHPLMKWAHPAMICSVKLESVTPNDPLYDTQWQHNQTSDFDMDTNLAWDYTRGSSAVETLVMDNGVQTDHPDLNWINGRDFTTGVVGGVGNGAPTEACDFHGTAVAGCTSARMNTIGVVGVSPSSQILGGKTADDVSCATASWSTSDVYVINALAWAVGQNAEVTNSSFSQSSSAAMSQAYEDRAVIDGMVHMAATGNDGAASISYPASAAFVYGVGNVQSDGTLRPSSNTGTGVQWVAPGTGVPSTDREGGVGYSSGDYTNFSGTSAASPMAAGVAALFRSMYPFATRVQTITAMNAGARDMGTAGYDTTFGWGNVNPYYTILENNPTNDNCSGTFFNTTPFNPAILDTTWATERVFEPQASCESGAAGEVSSVWYRFTAPTFCNLSVNTNGSDYDTVVSFWNGCGTLAANGLSFTNPSQLACDDDSGTGTQSQIDNFFVEDGDTIYIKVSKYGSTPGGGNLDFNATFVPVAPPNNTCGSSIDIPLNNFGTYNPAAYDVTNATSPTCDGIDGCGSNNDTSVWYTFTATYDGELDIDTEGSTYDTVLAIYGSSCPISINGICITGAIECDDDSGTGLLSSIQNFQVNAGQTYRIKVSRYGGNASAAGDLNFNFSYTEPSAPANDFANNAQVLVSDIGTQLSLDEIRTQGATASLCEGPISCGAMLDRSVWYRLTPDDDVLLTLNTFNSNYDTVINIFRGPLAPISLNGNCINPAYVTCNDDANINTSLSEVRNVQLAHGQTYWIRISPINGANAFTGRLRVNYQIRGVCDSIDFNQNGVFPEDQDVIDFFNVLAGAPCPAQDCNIDFNNNGVFPEDEDIIAYFRVLSGGTCLP